MSTYLQFAVMTVAVVLFASLAHAEPILPYSATGPVEIVDYQGNLWRAVQHFESIKADGCQSDFGAFCRGRHSDFERRGEVSDASVGI